MMAINISGMLALSCRSLTQFFADSKLSLNVVSYTINAASAS
jgi:hypothetical protein